MKKIVTLMMAVVVAAGVVQANTFDLQKANLAERMSYHRAIDAALWAMPLMNFKFYRDSLAKNGVGPNDVGYNSQLQDWRFQTATPNNTTPYIHCYWNLKDGPVVIEMPASEDGVGVFGTIMDAWQRPLEDVGAKGRDKGAGATYLLIPPGYNGKLLPKALVYEQETLNGFTALRPILPGGATKENLAKATALTKKIKIYPLSQVDNPPKSKYVDVYGKMLEMTPTMDRSIYQHIHSMITEENVLDRDLAMMGLLARIGIKKNETYKPDTKLQAMFDKAAPEALNYMIDQYHRSGINPWMWEGKKWSSLVPEPGSRETDWRYEFPSYYDYHARGALYYAIITSVKNYGTATFYLDLAETQDGEWLYGDKNYKLTMPPNVPVEHFWSITTYDLMTASYLRNIEKSTIDSTMKEVKKNADGSIDIYFGPTPERGKESNWLRTDPKRRFFLLARFYGPKPELYGDNFELNNIERLE